MTKLVYDFLEGGCEMQDLLGSKGADLAEMTGSGRPVPPGSAITTAAWRAYRAGGDLPADLVAEVDEHPGWPLWQDLMTSRPGPEVGVVSAPLTPTR